MDNNTVHNDAVLALADLKGAFALLATATAYIRHADGGGELRDNRPSDAYNASANAGDETLQAIRFLESFCANPPVDSFDAAAAGAGVDPVHDRGTTEYGRVANDPLNDRTD